MALYLSSSNSSTLEPVRKNRWIFSFTSIPGASSKEDALSFLGVSANRPQLTIEQKEHHRMNERFYTAGKPTWAPITATYYDFIQGADGASDILYNWMTRIYNPITGQMFFKQSYTTSCTMAMLDPEGGIVEVWNLFYVWPTDVNWGDVSADSDDICTVTTTFRYDFAVKGQNIDTSV